MLVLVININSKFRLDKIQHVYKETVIWIMAYVFYCAISYVLRPKPNNAIASIL